MKKIPVNTIQGELVLFTQNPRLNNTILALTSNNKLRKLADGVFTTNFSDDTEDILSRNANVLNEYRLLQKADR